MLDIQYLLFICSVVKTKGKANFGLSLSNEVKKAFHNFVTL